VGGSGGLVVGTGGAPGGAGGTVGKLLSLPVPAMLSEIRFSHSSQLTAVTAV
jgi:hypothetical protein